MGKRRRAEAKREGAKSKNRAVSGRDHATRVGRDSSKIDHSLDIDDDCVQYASGSEEGSMPPRKGARQGANKGYDDAAAASSDAGDNESSADELVLGDVASDESDAEVGLEFFDPTDADITPASLFVEKFTFECAGTTKEAAGKNTKAIPARQLATAICEQKRVGTMVRVTNEEAPIGFISCLNVHVHRKLLRPLREHLVGICGEQQEHARFRQLLERAFDGGKKFESGKMGLIVCERVVNLPVQIVPKMLEALFCEIEWAIEDEPSEVEREAFRLGWYLYVTQVYCTGRAEGQPQRKQLKGEADEGTDAKIAFGRVEDEVWFKFASCHVMWDITGAESEKDGFRRRRIAMIVAAGKVPKIRENIETLVGGGDSSAGDEDRDGQEANGANQREK